MNREIKFRAYQPEAKGDLKWWSWQELRECDLNTIFRHPERYHLMQYTGLKDKNGVEIYEGDIVVAFRGEDCEEVNAVYYNANHCKWFLGSPYNNKLPMGLGEFCWLDLEVIGNIYDNPELLEVPGND